LGQQLTPGSIAVNRFSIDASNNLVCLGNGNANPQPFIEGVEDMQILYGITNGDANQSANRYVEASAAGSADWNNVVSVRICLLLSTTEDNLADQPLSFQNCNGNMVPANDRRLRRIFTSTINLRNKINTSPALWN
jgi:type IV pilus assembly protein PilW